MIQIGKRITAEDSVIRIASPKNFFILVFVPMWLFIWTVGGLSVMMQFAASGGRVDIFLFLWLSFWLGAELFALYAFLWSGFGSEILTIEFGNLKVKRSIFGFGPSRSYQTSKIANLRAVGLFTPEMIWEYSMSFWGLTGGSIAFDYEGKTERFGIGLEEEEASQLVGELRGRLNLPAT